MSHAQFKQDSHFILKCFHNTSPECKCIKYPTGGDIRQWISVTAKGKNVSSLSCIAPSYREVLGS